MSFRIKKSPKPFISFEDMSAKIVRDNHTPDSEIVASIEARTKQKRHRI